MSHAAAAEAEAAPRSGPKRPRRIRNDALSPDYRARDIAPMPADRRVPFLLLRRGGQLVLSTSWPARRRGLTDAELAVVADIERWISDTGAARMVTTAAWLTADGIVPFEPQAATWVARRLHDYCAVSLAT